MCSSLFFVVFLCSFDSVCLDPVCLNPVFLAPVCLDPVCLDHVCPCLLALAVAFKHKLEVLQKPSLRPPAPRMLTYMDPVCLDPFCQDPVCLNTVFLAPVCLDPVCACLLVLAVAFKSHLKVLQKPSLRPA